MVPYDTYIISEKNLGAMLFAKNIPKNINTFWGVEAQIFFLTTPYFIGFFFRTNTPFVQFTYVNSSWNSLPLQEMIFMYP